MSGSYRQTSVVTPELLEVDPDNKYLARAKRMRWPAWMLRDQALQISGLLVDSVGGPPVKPYQPAGIWEEATFGKIKYQQDQGEALYRRSLYTFWRRIVGPTMLFDNASRQYCAVKTSNTNTPLHALTTLNDITYVEAARVMAARIIKEATDDEERIKLGFLLATSRYPSEEEIAILSKRLAALQHQYSELPQQAEEITSIGEFPIATKVDITDHAAFTAICSLLLNLDETITRQ
jgi:hypothetical protein